jgi:hypothetical protein
MVIINELTLNVIKCTIFKQQILRNNDKRKHR